MRIFGVGCECVTGHEASMETRHLWVGNLPENVREDKIIEHFKRYGHVESVKLLPSKGAGFFAAAFVDFVDIRSAQKAHNAVNKLGGRELRTEYKAPRDLRESLTSRSREVSGFRRGSRVPTYSPPLSLHTRVGRYERIRYRASETLERTYEHSAYGLRERGIAGFERTRHYDQDYYRDSRDRILQRGIYYNSRRSPSRFDAYDLRYESRTREPFTLPSVVRRDIYRDDVTREVRRRRRIRRPQRSPGRKYKPSRSRSPRSRNQSPQELASQAPKPDRSPSGNGIKSRSSSSDSVSSRNSHNSGSDDSDGCAAVPAPPSQPILSPDKPRKSFGVKVQNLPVRSSDTTLNEGLFYEFKKYGKVTSVQICGVSKERYGLVFFKQQVDQEEALSATKGRRFLGMKIEVTALEEPDGENNSQPLDDEIDDEINEFHPKASRTLFIGNLEKTATCFELYNVFQQFGDIVDVDIKLVNEVPTYAFVEYMDITSVCKAINEMDRKYLGKNRLKLGFGKSIPSNCVLIDGLSSGATKTYLRRYFRRYGPVLKVVYDHVKHRALVFYKETEFAQAAVQETKNKKVSGTIVKLDFAKQAMQLAFHSSMVVQEQAAQGDCEVTSEMGSDAGSDSSDGCAAVPAPPSQSDDDEPRKSFGIKVENLPVRRRAAGLQYAIYKEYKKYGELLAVQIRGAHEKLYGLVFFRHQEDQQDALNASEGKVILGFPIKATAWEETEIETEFELPLLDKTIDEFHPKATRTLLIGNLEETITSPELHNVFQQFGEIVDIEIEKVHEQPTHALLQYCDITSACKAIRQMHGEYLGKKPLKVAFGKSVPTDCVWIGGLPMYVSEEYLTHHFNQYGPVLKVLYDRVKGMALVLYSEVEFAQAAIKETKGRKLAGTKIKLDFANQASKLAFHHSMEAAEQAGCDATPEDCDVTSEMGSDAESDSSDGCAAVPAPPSQPLRENKEPRKGFGIKVESGPGRRKATDFKFALCKEFKKYGELLAVQVHGPPKQRYGLVFFKHQEEQQKALKTSKGNRFLGWKIKMTEWEKSEIESEIELPLKKEKMDEFHPWATRTLFVGNLEETTTRLSLRNVFQQFGEIVDIEIKSVHGVPQYAFVQYCDITSVCEAISKMQGEYLGKKRLKVGFGKCLITDCVWIGGLPSDVSDKYLMRHFIQYGPVLKVVYDRVKGRALVLYSETEFAQAAVKATKRRKISGSKVKVDFANQGGQLAFCSSMGLSIQEIYDLVEDR